MRLSIAYNKEKNGIELMFVPKLSDKMLEDYLIDLGFKKSNSKGGIWYVTDRPSYNDYTKRLREAFKNGIDPKTIKVAPSYDVDRNHIDHYEFSLVNIKTDDDKDEDKGVDYVIFDDLKKIASDIATRFAKAKFGSRLNSVSVSPRNFKRRARNAFDEGRIITGVSEIKKEEVKIIETEKKNTSKEEPKWLKTREAYLLDSGGSEKELKDEEYIDAVAHEHEQLLLDALLAGNTIPDDILEGYPNLNKPDDFGYSYRAMDFGSIDTFLKILESIGNKGEYYTARYNYDEPKGAHAYVWKGNDVNIVTASNPLLYGGYASRMGVQGKRDTTIKLINTINDTQEYGGELGLVTIGFSKLTLSDRPYSYTSYTNENGVYTKDHAGERYDTIRIPFPLKSKFEATIKLVQDEQDQYLYGLSVTNTLSGWSGYSFSPSRGDNTYPSKEEAIEFAFLQILDGLQYEHTEAIRMGASESMKKIYEKIILRIFDFADKIKIKLPEERSKAVLPLQVDGEEPKKKEKAEKNTEESREWEKRGQQVFEDLGFPTDANYPYVNINSGYRSVYPLQSIIGGFDKPQNWWSAANNYRPIGDLEKALEIIEEQKAEFKTQQLIHTNPKTGAPKSKKEDKEAYQQIQYKMEDLDTSKELITSFLKEQKRKLSTPKLKEPKPVEKTSVEEFFLVKSKDADRIRKEFVTQGFPIPFTGQEAFRDNLPIFNLAFRWHISYSEFEKKQEIPINKKKSIFTSELSSLEGKIDTDSLAHKEKLKTTIHQLDSELETARDLLEKENWIFQDELFAEAMKRVREKGCHPDAPKIAQFYDVLLTGLVGNKVMDTQDRTPVLQKVDFLIDDFLMEHSTGSIEQASAPSSDYLDKVIAIMHDHYIDAKRLSRKQIEAVQQESGAPNLGVLWEAVELSWLLWYQQIYNLPIPFERRLNQMMEFWNTVQPTYAYSDSSKELFKQYSTPCPIGAMIAEYTNMSSADRTFEPSAGNGLLVLGADPKKTHVNEIDKSRRYSLKAQGFDTITHRNAAEPFPEEWTHSFDVMVTNPPFASWDDSKFDKERWTQKYFNNQIGVAQHMRLEHFMAGLALHTLKDSGKAAIIIMGHVYFGSDGYIEKYKPFFNWLYRHYHVEDIINMNSYKLYNKQGAVTKTMLILIHGRKEVPEGIAPTKRESPTIEQVVNSFQELWERIDSHIKKPVEYSLQVIITQLKIELGL